MKTVYSEFQLKHAGHFEFYNGSLVEGFEKPSRAQLIVDRIRVEKLGGVVDPSAQSLETARKIHSSDYLEFLPTAWQLWSQAGRSGTALPYAWPTRGRKLDSIPNSIDGLLGYYSIDSSTGFVEGTWDAVKASQDTSLTAADLLADGEKSCFALCRPPGHHAGKDFNGGYCFINNAAIAAQRLLDRGASRVSILDIDYHHGNGTQEIFYWRDDVQFISLHGDPRYEYPFFSGYSRERGAGRGEGFNLNLPLADGTDWPKWLAALHFGLENVRAFAADALVVSLGVDTFAGDPISRFSLTHADFPQIGAEIARLGMRTLFVMEGGYAVDDIGLNVVGVLTGYKDAAPR